ncbi:MAG: hypothetical protein EGQ14_06290 [Spirochaetia bacterium]|nr:hypothetical protein [Spirochaetia bacterium]
MPTRHPDSYVTQPSWPFQAHTPNFFQPTALSLLYTSYTGAFSASAAPGLVGIASRKDSISGLAILSRGGIFYLFYRRKDMSGQKNPRPILLRRGFFTEN